MVVVKVCEGGLVISRCIVGLYGAVRTDGTHLVPRHDSEILGWDSGKRHNWVYERLFFLKRFRDCHRGYLISAGSASGVCPLECCKGFPCVESFLFVCDSCCCVESPMEDYLLSDGFCSFIWCTETDSQDPAPERPLTRRTKLYFFSVFARFFSSFCFFSHFQSL